MRNYCRVIAGPDLQSPQGPGCSPISGRIKEIPVRTSSGALLPRHARFLDLIRGHGRGRASRRSLRGAGSVVFVDVRRTAWANHRGDRDAHGAWARGLRSVFGNALSDLPGCRSGRSLQQVRHRLHGARPKRPGEAASSLFPGKALARVARPSSWRPRLDDLPHPQQRRRRGGRRASNASASEK